MDNVAVNSHGTNSKFKFNILSDKEMYRLGFTDHDKSCWYFHREMQYDISFNVMIPKDGSEAWIDVLDEEFLQPYDWQYILSKSSNSSVALIVDNFVRENIEYLCDNGVIENYCKGDYI